LFLQGIRNRIQHYAGNEIDDLVAPKIQANVLDFDDRITFLTDARLNLKSRVPLVLQFKKLSLLQTKQLITVKRLPDSMKTFILNFEDHLSEVESTDTAYEAQIKFNLENKNRGKDLLEMEIVGVGAPVPEGATIIANKEVEKKKYRPSEIVSLMEDEGHGWFTMSKHTNLWKARDAKDPKKGYGVMVSKQWYWYQRWIDEQVRPYCEKGELKGAIL
jgi:hypothetical protein